MLALAVWSSASHLLDLAAAAVVSLSSGFSADGRSSAEGPHLDMGDSARLFWAFFLPGLLASVYLGLQASPSCGLIILLTTGAIAGLAGLLLGSAKKDSPDPSPRIRGASLSSRNADSIEHHARVASSADSLAAAYAALALCKDLESPSALKCVARVAQHLNADRQGRAVQLAQIGAAQLLTSALAALPDHSDKALVSVTSLLVEILNQPAALQVLRQDEASFSELLVNYLRFGRRLAQTKLVNYSSVDSKTSHIASRYQMVVGLSLLVGESSRTSTTSGQEAVEILMELCCHSETLLQSANLMRCVLCALGILCGDNPDVLSHLCRQGAVEAIQRILLAHPEHHAVVHDACVVLYLLVREYSEERARCLHCGLGSQLLALQRSLPPTDPTAPIIVAILGLVGSIL